MAESKPDLCTIEGCGRPYRCRGWCVAHWLRWRKYGDVDAGRPIRTQGDDAARFIEKVDKRGPDECWPWTGLVDDTGYGRFTAGKVTLAHRWSYLHFTGPIPEGFHVDHTCHNADRTCIRGAACLHRRCVNPAHLDAVPLEENSYRANGASIETCRAGHPRTPDNMKKVGKYTACLACSRKRAREWKRAKVARQRANAAPIS